MRIINKKKLIVRILELLIIISTIILTPISINYANKIRGYIAYGGEFLIPVLGLIIIFIIEAIYEDSENKERSKRCGKDRLHDCYIWHIITLATMEHKLKELKGGKGNAR